jgi:hypothetical protein
MSTDSKVLIQLQADTKDINAKLASLGDVLSSINTHTKNLETVGKSTWAIYATGINQVIDLAGKAYNAVHKMVGLANQLAMAYGAQEQAEVKLSAALAAHGIHSDKVTQALVNQASALQMLTGEEDEAIMNAQAMMLTMGVLPSKIDAATRAALDISRVFGKDLQGSAALVAQAMEGNTRGLVKLIPALKGMEKGALDADGVLRKLNEAMQGMSEKEGETYVAQVRKLNAEWGDFKETLGKSVIPTLRELISMVRDGITAVQGLLGESSVAVKKQQLDMLNRQIEEAEKAVAGDWKMDFKIRATTMTDPAIMLEKWKSQRSALQDELRQTQTDDNNALKEADKDFIKERSHALDSLIKKWQEGMPKLKLDVEFAGAPGGGGYFREMAEADAEALKMKEEYRQILNRVVDAEGNTVGMIIDQVAAAKKLNAEKKAYMEFAKIALDVDDQLKQRAQYLFDLSKKRRENEVEAARDSLEEGRRNLEITRGDYTQGQIDNYDKLIEAEEERYELLDKSLLTEKQQLEVEEEKNRRVQQYRHQIKLLRADLKVETGTGDEGLKRGFDEWVDEAKSGYENMRDLAKGAAQEMSNTFGEMFFDVMEGKFKNLGDYISNFAKNVLKMIADILGQMAAMALIKGAMGFSGFGPSFTFHEGGRGLGEASGFRLVPSDAFATARRYHSGLTPDEVPMIVQRREMPYIFTPEQMKGLAGMMQSSMSFNMPITVDDPRRAKQLKRNLEREAKKTIRGWL